MENRILTDGVHEFSAPSARPGWRAYTVDSTGGWTMTKTETPGALVLWNPEGYEGGPFDAYDVHRVVDERYRRLPRGTMQEHTRRAGMIARALCDGAYIAVEQLDRVFQLRMGERTADQWAALKRAHDLANPTYTRLRDYLGEDEQVPYVVACVVAALFADDGPRTLLTRWPF